MGAREAFRAAGGKLLEVEREKIPTGWKPLVGAGDERSEVWACMPEGSKYDPLVMSLKAGRAIQEWLTDWAQRNRLQP